MNLHRRSILIAAVMCTALTPVSFGQENISDVEKRVFMTDHLKNVTPPTTLNYQFTKSGSLEKGLEGKVSLALKAPKNGLGKDCHVEFLSGESQFKGVPDMIENATGNPVILAFLERDLIEMKRLTRGQPNYYRKRLRMAMAERAKAKAVTVNFSGKDVAANEIFLTPFEEDPARSRYEKFSNKSYTITLSDAVPGGVYKIHSRMIDRAAKGSTAAKPMIEETLIFTGSNK